MQDKASAFIGFTLDEALILGVDLRPSQVAATQMIVSTRSTSTIYDFLFRMFYCTESK